MEAPALQLMVAREVLAEGMAVAVAEAALATVVLVASGGTAVQAHLES